MIQRHISTRGQEYEWALKPDKKSLRELLSLYRVAITISVLYLLLATGWFLFHIAECCLLNRVLIAAFEGLKILLLLSAGVAFLILLLASIIARDKNLTAERQPDAAIRRLAASQLGPVLNEMTAAGPLKKGILRKHFYAAALRVLAFVRAGQGIPTVSNIRWVLTDKNRRMVFLSNYANSTDFYVRDFLNGTTPLGVNFVFTCAAGFPDAKMLLYRGITDQPEGYMNAVHFGQVVTDLWYAHDPESTVDVIQRNRQIREGLFRSMNEYEAWRWLKLL